MSATSCGTKKTLDVKNEVPENPIIVIWELKSEMVGEPCNVVPFFVELLFATGEFEPNVSPEGAVGGGPFIFKVCSKGQWGGSDDGDF